MNYTADFKSQTYAVGAAVTSNALTCATGDYITLLISASPGGWITTWSITNTGDAISWNLRDHNVSAGTPNNDSEQWLYEGIAGATPPGTITATATAGGDMQVAKSIFTACHTDAHATTPMPAGNIFKGATEALTDVSQAITPTASGSCLWMVCADRNGTNSFAAGSNCTLEATGHEGPYTTTTVVRPTTQPRSDAAAFTLSETDSGLIAFMAWEVQAAAAAAGALNSLDARIVRRIGA